MNILYVLTKLELGGAQKVCLNLIKHFKKNNNVFLISGKEGKLVEKAEKLLGDNFIQNPYLTRKISPLNDYKAYKFIKNFLDENDIEIVHTHSSKAGVLGRLAAYRAKVDKIIHTVHGFAFNDFKNPLVNQLYKNIERYVSHFSDKLIAVTSKDIKKGLDNNIGTKEKYSLIRAAVNTKKFIDFKPANNIYRYKYNIPKNAFIITQISCFKKQKNPLDFIKLAKKVIDYLEEDIYFFLVGDGQLREKIKKKIKELKISDRVFLTGWEDDVRPYIFDADIITLTSLWEGLPITIVESFLMKKTVIVTSVDGNKEIVDNGLNGFLYEPGDLENALDKILILYYNKELLSKMGKKGYKKVKKEFSLKKMLKDTEKIYYG